MWSLKISRRLASRKSSKRRSGAAQFRLPLGQRRFGIEPLEQRTLLTTGTISVVSGVLTIASGAGQNNALTIGLDASTATIDISDSAGNNYNISGISNTTGSGTNFITIPVASVLGDNIAVATLDGSDSLTVNLANGNPAPGGTITYTSTTGTKALTVEEGTLPTGDTLSVTSAAISGTAIPFTVDYSTTGGTFGGGVTLTSAAVNDTVNILSTLSGVDYNIKAGGGNNSALNFTGDATQNVTVDIGRRPSRKPPSAWSPSRALIPRTSPTARARQPSRILPPATPLRSRPRLPTRRASRSAANRCRSMLPPRPRR